MSATLSAQAGSEKTTGPSEAKVDKAGKPTPAAARPRRLTPERQQCAISRIIEAAKPTQVVARLRRLAPVHRRAAISRAMRLAGVHGKDKPTLDTLAASDNPPAPRWREVLRPDPTEAEIRAAAAATISTPAWRAHQTMLTSKEQQMKAAMEEALSMRLLANCTWPKRTMTNGREWFKGQRLAATWRPVLRVLAGMLDAVDALVPDAWLSSIEEPELKAAAEAAAELGFLTTPADQMDTPDAKRARCPMHHRRVLRRRAATARQHLAALLGTIGAGGAPYADAYAVSCWRQRQAAAAFFGMNRVLLFDDGTQVPMWDVMEASRRARMAALYVQTLGLDELAQRRGLLPVFITMTLPPQHHPNPKHGLPYAGLDWKNAPSPEKTDAALSNLWARLRSRLDGEGDGIGMLGLRVVEPHQDGCPHLHALLYMRDEWEAGRLDWHLQKLCPEPVKDKRIASKLVRIDRGKASPASYVMKYLLKTVNAPEDAAKHADGVIHDGDPDHLAHHDQVQAWASERRLRRFAWLGLHGIRTVWQRVRSMNDDEMTHAPDSVRDAATAMHAGEWADALEALGAVRADGRERVRLTYATKENAYGEDVKRPDGLALGGWRMPLRRRTCRIVRPQPEPQDRTPAPAPAQESNKGITVVVSCPRATPHRSAECQAAGRTGPPDAPDQGAAPNATPKPLLTTAPPTRERRSRNQAPAKKRTPLEWTPGMFRTKAIGIMPPMPEKARQPRFRTEPDDEDLWAMTARLDDARAEERKPPPQGLVMPAFLAALRAKRLASKPDGSAHPTCDAAPMQRPG